VLEIKQSMHIYLALALQVLQSKTTSLYEDKVNV
jgi:hypothetical protein